MLSVKKIKLCSKCSLSVDLLNKWERQNIALFKPFNFYLKHFLIFWIINEIFKEMFIEVKFWFVYKHWSVYLHSCSVYLHFQYLFIFSVVYLHFQCLFTKIFEYFQNLFVEYLYLPLLTFYLLTFLQLLFVIFNVFQQFT